MVKLRSSHILLATLALIVLMMGSLAVGPASLSLSEFCNSLINQSGPEALIVLEIRLPRTVLAAATGFVLGLSGAALQILVRNPLAEPALIGAPQAAALGAVLSVTVFGASAISLMAPVAAIALVSLNLVAVMWLAFRHPGSGTLLLAGLGAGTLSGAMVALALSLSNNPYAIMEIVFWLMGSFEDRSWQHVSLAVPFMAVGTALVFFRKNGLDVLALGEDVAGSLGLSITQLLLWITGGVSLMVGACVAVSGAIGFIGLLAPHLARALFRTPPSGILLPSALLGAVLLLASDIAVRLIPTQVELRVGVVTALVGAPFFLYVLFKKWLPETVGELR